MFEELVESRQRGPDLNQGTGHGSMAVLQFGNPKIYFRIIPG